MGEADPRKALKNADNKYIAALSDVRLEGSSEAVYFVLRGLGMKASQGPNCLPRIEVMACQHPKLFAALRRLNLRHVRDTIILEPSGSGPGNPASADRSVERQVRTDVSPPTDTAHPAPLLRGASSSSLAAQQREQRKKRIRDRKAAAIERLAAPKFLSAKLPFQMAWIEEHRREGEAVPVKPPEQVVPHTGAESQARQFIETQSTKAEEPEEKTWSRLKPVRSVEEQKEYFSKLSEPRSIRPKVPPFELAKRVQSSFGRAAERHLLARLEKIHESKAPKAEEQDRSKVNESLREALRALCESDDDDLNDGVFPPDPSPALSETEDSA